MNGHGKQREPTALLRDAARLVQKALDQLDGSVVACKCCGLKKSNNPAERKVLDRLGPVVAKLQETASDLQDNKTKAAADEPQGEPTHE